MENKLSNRIIINYKIETLSDMHIGGASTILPSGVDNALIKDNNGNPFIPGTSLKGVLRSTFERLLNATGKTVCEIFGKNMGGCGKCLVCNLFGGGHKPGMLKIRDAFLLSDGSSNRERVYIRDGVAIDRKTGKSLPGAKYDLEVVEKGTTFEGQMVIENTSTDEGHYTYLGGLLSLVKFFNEFVASIGAGTSKGLGNIKITLTSLKEITAKDYIEGNFEGKELSLEEIEADAFSSWKNIFSSALREEKNERS